MNQAAIIEALPPEARKFVEPGAPAPARMMAARGMVPLRPREQVGVLAGLTFDSDDKVVEAARASLVKMPPTLLAPILAGDLAGPVLDVLADVLAERDDLLEPMVLNAALGDDALARLAPRVSEAVAELITNNQERCLRSEALVRAIRTNPRVLRSSLDRLFDFLVRSGVIYDDMPEFAEAIARLSPTEMQQAAEKIHLPEAVVELLDHAPIPAAPALPETVEEGELELADLETDSAHVEKHRMSVQQMIASLNVAQRVALALRGNKEARTFLVRDSNRVVAGAAIRSPRITEQEVVIAAQSRSVSDEVVRVISTSKEMMRSYRVKLALINNPKTPLATAMRLLTLLRQNDLRAVAKSKNVTSALANQAKRLVNAKAGAR